MQVGHRGGGGRKLNEMNFPSMKLFRFMRKRKMAITLMARDYKTLRNRGVIVCDLFLFLSYRKK